MKIYPIGELWPWLPRSQLQMRMTAEQIQVDNYCREVIQILNKVTPQNVDKLLEQMATLNMDNEFNISKLVYYIVQKAESEPLYSEVYAEMCFSLNQIIDRLTSVVTQTAAETTENLCGLFKTLIMKECGLEFDKIFYVDELEADQGIELVSPREPMRLHSYRQKMFGIIIFIGQLYKIGFLREDILTGYIHQLLDEQEKMSLEFQVECLCKLLRTVGLIIECQQEKKTEMDKYFLNIDKICLENEFCSRVRFAVLDLKDLRQNNWIGRRVTETPMTIDQIRNSYACSAISTGKKKKKKNKN